MLVWHSCMRSQSSGSLGWLHFLLRWWCHQRGGHLHQLDSRPVPHVSRMFFIAATPRLRRTQVTNLRVTQMMRNNVTIYMVACANSFQRQLWWTNWFSYFTALWLTMLFHLEVCCLWLVAQTLFWDSLEHAWSGPGFMCSSTRQWMPSLQRWG